MLYIIAFLSGILTILTPCVLPMLPILLGARQQGQKNKIHSYVIIFSLITSIFIFTIFLKKIFDLFLPAQTLQIIGAIIIGVYGFLLLFPNFWSKISNSIGLNKISGKSQKTGLLGDIILGASLGPIFTSCTPTYLLIVGLIFGEEFTKGAIALAFYCLGFGLILLLVSLFGRKITSKLSKLSSENGIFKKILGIICIIFAILIGTGLIKNLEAKITENYQGLSSIENNLLKSINKKNNLNDNKSIMFDTKKEQNFSDKEETAYFAGGCFWCIEGIMDAQTGVKTAISGYIGIEDFHPSYEQVSSGETKFREGVKVVYDPTQIDYETLVKIFFHQIDPTDGEGQFADRGFHYSPAVYYNNENEKALAEKYISELDNSKKFDKKIAVKIENFPNFYEAEEYHQNYSVKNVGHYNRYKIGSGRAKFIEDNWKNENEKIIEFSAEKLKNSKEKYNILFFHAEWCSSCKAILRDFEKDGVPENMMIFLVDYDKNLELRKKYNVVTQTTFVLVDKNGNLIKRWIPALGISDLEEQVKNISINQKKSYSDAELRAKLTPLQYKVTQEGYTEPPFQNEYWNNKEPGIYVDVIDGTPLFSSTDKFDSGTGWPSFSKTIEENFIEEKDDFSHGMIRTEVKSGDSHLGHIFDDGPTELGGKRYCINSAALKFIHKKDLEKEGYGKYLKLFK